MAKAENTTRNAPGTTLTQAGDANQAAGKKRESLPENDEQSVRKRARANPGDALVPVHAISYEQSTQFWYPDGNIILIVEGVGFKLYRARLAAYCHYFANLTSSLADEGNSSHHGQLCSGDGEDGHTHSMDDSRPSSDGRPQHPRIPSYEIKDLAACDFRRFLSALDTPLKYFLEPPRQSTAISLLRAAKRLECEAVGKVAKRTLLDLWNNEVPNGVIPLCPYSDAVSVIDIARKFHLPEMLKCAFYELLRSPAFWAVLADDRHSVDTLSEADLLNLHNARYVLQREWRAMVLTPPFAGPDGSHCASVPTPKPKKCKHTAADARVGFWRSHFIDSEVWEMGALDPIGGINGLRDAAQGLKNAWCVRCLNERKEAWEAAKVRWWGMLDDLFQLRQNM
ncbi:hypothetical protein OH77DRAFT_1431563 [Trametes cingulata]|nr:hypothetical protein OH77DRAFT_1431563 [Trametes cingulata]